MKYDVLVLGAGMVGVSCALHLQSRGKSVVLFDRREPGLETSFGNSGIIQREAIEPYELPRKLSFLASAILNRRLDVRFHPRAIGKMAGPLLSYYRNSAKRPHAVISKAYESIIALSLETHGQLIKDANAQSLLGGRGYLTVFRTEKELHALYRKADERARHGVGHHKMNGSEVGNLEPSLTGHFVGGVYWTDPITVKSPGDLVQAYAGLFEDRGGDLSIGDASSLTKSADGGWHVKSADGGVIEADEVVIALGPWSVELTSRYGYKPPMFIKRGYHMHFTPKVGRQLNHWVIDAEMGYVVCPMKNGLRLTTGAELAEIDAPMTPLQLAAAEKIARCVFPLGEKVDQKPWMGGRPCMPDMKPVIGAVPFVPGMWCAFGHGHQGFTLGPATGELLADLMTGAKTKIDAAPFAPSRAFV
ncbi:NAD(P)/FAD-dependent oxidoreductase [Paraburkholderia sp. IW21]|uniref:NAD(P)/FAD-dependent oxidoreductase n=1 Tax=Paraburkholderia sp. IW21 TaxID=3242488 RepID=UPI0035200936